MWKQELCDIVEKKDEEKKNPKYNDKEDTQNYIVDVSPSRKIITIIWVNSPVKNHKCSGLIREQKLNNMLLRRHRFKMKRFKNLKIKV